MRGQEGWHALPFTQFRIGVEWLVPYPSELGLEWDPQPVWKIRYFLLAGSRSAWAQMLVEPNGCSGPSRFQGPSRPVEVACTTCMVFS